MLTGIEEGLVEGRRGFVWVCQRVLMLGIGEQSLERCGGRGQVGLAEESRGSPGCN